MTFTVAAALVPGALALMVVEPAPTDVTGTGTLLWPGPKLTVAGTVAAAGLLELRVTVKGSEPLWVSVRFPEAPTINPRGDPRKLMVGPLPTVTVWLAEDNPVPEAVMIADPLPIPVTVGTRLGAVAPCGMKILVGEIATFDGSLLIRLRNTPPEPAGLVKVTGKSAVWPTTTRTPAGRIMSFAAVIVTVEGVLLVTPLFTINCTTYIPATSVTKVGVAVLAPDRVALLPGGRVVNENAYVRGS